MSSLVENMRSTLHRVWARQHSHGGSSEEDEVETWVTHHWGYYDRTHPCTNDPGSCDYLDYAYWSHDMSMIYSAVIWATVVVVLLVLLSARLLPARGGRQHPGPAASAAETTNTPRAKPGFMSRVFQSSKSASRRGLLQDCFRPVFGRVSRLQVLIVAVFTVYVTVFSFVSVGPWRTWRTPVRGEEGVYNLRTTLGPFTDRVGVLAYALMPLSVLLANRESFLSAVTGIPYQHFNFLHRWLGYIIAIQTTVHSFGRTVLNAHLYQPQPEAGNRTFGEIHIIWGVVGMVVMAFLYVFTLPPVIRLTGYEFFRKSHYVLVMIFTGTCIGHWMQLKVFLIPVLCIWGLDRLLRLLRTFLLHYKVVDGKRQFVSARADVTYIPDADAAPGSEDSHDVIRLDFRHPHSPWSIGQHFYLCFPESSIWQSHPFSPLSLPETGPDGLVAHSYILRTKSGETRKIAQLAAASCAEASADRFTSDKTKSTAAEGVGASVHVEAGLSVILSGPYGGSITSKAPDNANVLCVVAGTGIAYATPLLLSLARLHLGSRRVKLVWIVRHQADKSWVAAELEAIQANSAIEVQIIATRQSGMTPADHNSSSSALSLPRVPSPTNDAVSGERSRHPDVARILKDFIEGNTTGPTAVFASGPGALMSDLRGAVAKQNSGSKVWRGEERYNVWIECDERLER